VRAGGSQFVMYISRYAVSRFALSKTFCNSILTRDSPGLRFAGCGIRGLRFALTKTIYNAQSQFTVESVYMARPGRPEPYVYYGGSGGRSRQRPIYYENKAVLVSGFRLFLRFSRFPVALVCEGKKGCDPPRHSRGRLSTSGQQRFCTQIMYTMYIYYVCVAFNIYHWKQIDSWGGRFAVGPLRGSRFALYGSRFAVRGSQHRGLRFVVCGPWKAQGRKPAVCISWFAIPLFLVCN
jgi:hypothetical protein